LVRQRGNIVGGTGKSDLPGFYCWLHKNPKQRQAELNEWLAPLEPLRDANDLNLYLIRNNAHVSTQVAETGLFQTTLASGTSYQLVQVVLPVEQIGYPDIRVGRRNLTIKFMEQTQAQRLPLPSKQDINFELRCCTI
jgi:cell division protein ZapD